MGSLSGFPREHVHFSGFPQLIFPISANSHCLLGSFRFSAAFTKVFPVSAAFQKCFPVSAFILNFSRLSVT